MAKFNRAGKAPVNASKKKSTVTFEGAAAYEKSSEMELYQAVVTTLFGEGKFYETGDERAKRLRRLIRRCVEQGSATFVAKLAVYTRERMHLRSVPLFLTVELLSVLRELESDFDNRRGLVARVIQRADELREMFAAAEATFGDANNNKLFKRQVPRALLKGIGDAFNKFDAYQFRKYSGGKGSIKFTDVMRVVHPTPKDEEQSELFRQIMTDTLPAIDTWETQSAAVGQQEYESAEAKAEAQKAMWQTHANDPKQGYMARLRNLRNYVTHDVDLENVVNHLTNPMAVAKSKQLPFRFYTAYRELGGDTLKRGYYGWGYQETEKTTAPAELLSAIEDAFDLSVANMPDLGDDVLIIADQSGSMTSPISSKSTVTCAEIAAVLGAAVWFNQTVTLGKKAMVAGFACRGKVYNWSKRTSALAAAKEMMNTNLGGSTRVETAWDAARKAKLKPSTIIVLSDMQMTGRSYWGNDSMMNPQAYGLADKDTMLISVDLQGYSATPFAENNGWYQLAGWSEKLFDLIEAMRKPGDAIKFINDQVDI